MLASAAEVAGVSDVALAWSTPFSGGRMANDIVFESGDSVGGRGRSNVDMNVVDGGFFRTLGIPLLAGRPFTEDDRADAAPVIVLNQALADRLWPGRNPLGMRLAQWNSAIDGPGELLEVVGVAANGRYARSWRSEDRPFMWLPLAQYPRRAMTLLVRTAGAEPETLARIRAAAVAAAPGLPSPEAAALTKSQTAAVSLQRTNARLLTLFGWLAIVVALIGVYGVVSFTVARRTHEIGVRLALGARPGDVRTMIMLGSAKPILGGVVAGVLLAAVAARWLTPMLFQVTPWDPATWATVLVGVLATGLLASHLPARRATRVDPVEVLRD
jgi:predicted permease